MMKSSVLLDSDDDDSDSHFNDDQHPSAFFSTTGDYSPLTHFSIRKMKCYLLSLAVAICFLLILIISNVISSNSGSGASGPSPAPAPSPTLSQSPSLPTSPPSPPPFSLLSSPPFSSLISTDFLSDRLGYLTDKAHLAGSARDEATAQATAEQWRSAGLDRVEILEYSVLLNEPNLDGDDEIFPETLPRSGDNCCASIELLASDSAPTVPLKLRERPPNAEYLSEEENPSPFSGYSASGDVTAPLLYVNYGRAEDFASHDRCSLLRGRVALIRYGRIFRGNKAKQAERCGAVGVILFSDPADYGPESASSRRDSPWTLPDQILPYPNGIYLPRHGVQRGSVWTGDGDPASMGYAAEAERAAANLNEALERARNDTLMHGVGLARIPIHPISADDANFLLEALTGDAVPPEWQGAVGPTYKLGPSTAQVRLRVATKYSLKKIYNVVGILKSKAAAAVKEDAVPAAPSDALFSTYDSQFVLIGNHRDAWTFGSADPSSGSTILDSIVGAFGSLHRRDEWRPRRSLVFCSWDAEEYGLIGSTEFVEQHLVDLQSQAAVYLNVDVGVGGNVFTPRGTPSLSTASQWAASRVVYNEQGETLFDNWQRNVDYDDTEQPQPSTGAVPSNPLKPSGSGSDMAPFQQLAGLSVMDIGFDMDGGYPLYHSNMDNLDFEEHLLDPGFTRHKAVAEFISHLAWRFSDQPILPFNFTIYGEDLELYVEKIAAALPSSTASSLLSPLHSAVAQFQKAAEPLMRATAIPDQLSMDEIDNINRRMIAAERAFLFSDGARGPSAYSHTVFRPSSVNSYASQQFPAIYETMDNERELKKQIEIVQSRIIQAAKILQI